jgi:Na+-driven multidrug efflux pump
MPALILGLSRQLIFMVPLLIVLPPIFGLNGLWAAFPIADLLGLIISVIWTRATFKELGIPFTFRSPKIDSAANA